MEGENGEWKDPFDPRKGCENREMNVAWKRKEVRESSCCPSAPNPDSLLCPDQCSFFDSRASLGSFRAFSVCSFHRRENGCMGKSVICLPLSVSE